MKFRKITALLLVLCMMLSLSISAFAADDVVASGTIQNSGIRWELNGNGWLTISGSGEAPVFQSADDQPWAEYREQITEVWYDDMSTLTISDLAYWFEGCTALTTAELPLAPVIGNHAFYGCDNLNTITMYYGETVLKSIGEDAFWREADAGDTLYIAYIIGYPEATVPFYTYDWAASNRSSRYFYDLYGVYQNADAATTAPSGIKKAPGISVRPPAPSLATALHAESIRSRAHTLKSHIRLAVMQTIMSVISATTSSTLALTPIRVTALVVTVPVPARTAAAIRGCCRSEQAATCTSNGYRSVLLRLRPDQKAKRSIRSRPQLHLMEAGMQYSASQHRRSKPIARNCGNSELRICQPQHELRARGAILASSQHSRTASCRTCGYSTTDYGNALAILPVRGASTAIPSTGRSKDLFRLRRDQPMTTPITAIPMVSWVSDSR